MDRQVFEKLSFWEKDIPQYQCPSCNRGVLQLRGEPQLEFTAETTRHKDEEWFDWEDHCEFVFSGKLVCGNCAEPFFIVGDGYPRSYEYEEPDGRTCQSLASYFKVKFIQPPLKFIECPEQLSDDFKAQIDSAFALYFPNPSACCNSIRCAVEVLLTEWEVPLKTDDGRYFPLGKRLELLPEKYSEFRDLLVAVKWLGNSGSHADQSFSHTNALDGFEMLEHVLAKAYDQLGPRLRAMAEEINAHKGPVRRP